LLQLAKHLLGMGIVSGIGVDHALLLVIR